MEEDDDDSGDASILSPYGLYTLPDDMHRNVGDSLILSASDATSEARELNSGGEVGKVSNCVKSVQRNGVFFGGGNEDMAEHEG